MWSISLVNVCKLQKIFLTRPPLIAFYKSLIRSHPGYRDVIYAQAYNVSFHQKLESIQYNAMLAITRAIRWTFKEVLKLLKAEDGIVTFIYFIKFSRRSHLGSYLTLSLQLKEPILQVISYLISKLNIIISKIISFLQLRQNGIIWI